MFSKKHHLTANKKQSTTHISQLSIQNGKKKNKELSFPQNFNQYILEDYGFLQDYELLESSLNSQNIFIAKIRDTDQLVKFKKIQYTSIQTQKGMTIFKRFEALVHLFQKGNVLADNMFILQEGSTYFYYIIEPYLVNNIDENFITLQQYLFENRTIILTFQSKLEILNKCKILLDNLSNFGVSYCGLDTKKILIDDQNNFYLLPFDLELSIQNNGYKRSYYSPQILALCSNSSLQTLNNSFSKWDIWSFGCIGLQIFLYLTPYFLSTSHQQQTEKYKAYLEQILLTLKRLYYESEIYYQTVNIESQCSIGDRIHFPHFKQNFDKIINFFTNALHINEDKRILSFQKLQQQTIIKKIFFNEFNQKEKSTSYRNQPKSVQLLKKFQIQTPRFDQQKDQFKQLNICPRLSNDHHGNYDFEMRFISIININPQYQQQNIRIKIRLSELEVFQFFIDPLKQSLKQYEINKKITIKQKSMKYFQDLLLEDIRITINNQLQSKQIVDTHICVNIGALTLIQQHKRIWQKPIQCSYEAQSGPYFGTRIKIRSEIKCTEQNSQELQNYFPNNTQLNLLQVKKSESEKVHKELLTQRLPLKELNKNILNSQKKIQQDKYYTFEKKIQKKQNIFLEITNKIEGITAYWKNKQHTGPLKYSAKTLNEKMYSHQTNISQKISQLLLIN